MKTEMANKFRFIFGSAIILIALFILYSSLNSALSISHPWINFAILSLLGISWFLPPVKEMSFWLLVRIVIIMVMSFMVGYIWS